MHPVLLQQLLFSSVCTKKRDYHATVHKYEMELLEEKRKQDHLQSQIRCLRKINLKQNEVSSQELNSSEGLQSFHLHAEVIFGKKNRHKDPFQGMGSCGGGNLMAVGLSIRTSVKGGGGCEGIDLFFYATKSIIRGFCFVKQLKIKLIG